MPCISTTCLQPSCVPENNNSSITFLFWLGLGAKTTRLGLGKDYALTFVVLG